MGFEQRKGRVDRYCCHAVRRNVAARHSAGVLSSDDPDPWRAAYALATDEHDTCGDFAHDGCTPGRPRSSDTCPRFLATVSREETVSVACSATPSRPGDVLADTRTFYDNATGLTTAPTRGLVSRTEKLSGWSGGPIYGLVSTSTYDAAGRLLSAKDALSPATSSVYTPSSGGPVTGTTNTNNLGHVSSTTLNPAWGVPVTEVDANSKRTDLSYDTLGRLVQVWGPTGPRPAASRRA